jgi:Flp pilus assembly protein TadD
VNFVVNSDRKSAEEHCDAALGFFADGRYDDAIAAFQKAIESDPTFTEPLHGLARVYQDLDRLDEAIEIANRIVELDADDVLAHTSLSILYQKKGLVPEAEAEANKARILGWKQQLRAAKKA